MALSFWLFGKDLAIAKVISSRYSSPFLYRPNLWHSLYHICSENSRQTVPSSSLQLDY